MEKLGIVQMKKFKDEVQQVLHLPGNRPGKVLEMAIVVDYSLSKEELQDLLPQIMKGCKSMGEVFRNVRCNLVTWKKDEVITQKTVPMMMFLASDFYSQYVQQEEIKHEEVLMAWLKKFQARARLILVITDGKAVVGDKKCYQEALQPFLGRKTIHIIVSEEKGVEINRKTRNCFIDDAGKQ